MAKRGYRSVTRPKPGKMVYARRKSIARRPYRRSKYPQLGSGAKMSYMSARLPSLHEMNAGLANAECTQTRVVIPWQRVGASVNKPGTQFVYPAFWKTERFNQVKDNWRQFAIKGLKIEWIPKASLPANNQNAAEDMFYNVGIQNSNENFGLADTKLQVAAGFRALTPRRRFKKWLPMKQLSKKEHLDWQDTGLDYGDNPPDQADTTLSDAWSMLTWNFTSPIPMDNYIKLGLVKLTWYITFRGQKSL